MTGILTTTAGLWIARGGPHLAYPLPGVLSPVAMFFPNVRDLLVGAAVTLPGCLASGLAVRNLLGESPADFRLPAPARLDRWSWLALLAAAACLGILCQRLATGPFRPAHLWLFAGGLGLGGLAFHRTDGKDPRAAAFDGHDVLFAFGCAALSAIVNSVRLTHWTFTAVGDEGEFFVLAKAIVEGRYAWSPFNLAGVYGDHPVLDSLLQAAVMKRLGADAFGWRVAEVLVLAAATALEYLLARILFGRVPAAFAALVVGVSHYLMAFTRIGYNNNHCVLYGLLVMTLLVLAWRTGRVSLLFAAGCAMGLCLYTFAAALLVWPLVLLLWLIDFARSPGRGPIRSALVLLLGWTLVVTPALSATGITHVTKILAAHGPREIAWQPAPTITSLISLVHGFLAFWVNDRWFHHYVAGPLIDPVTGVALAVGLVQALLRSGRTAERIALLWFLGGQVLVAVTAYSPQPFFTRLMLVMPGAGLLAGAALRALPAFVGNGLGRSRAWIAYVLVVAAVALPALNLHQLLVVGPTRLRTNPETLTRKVLAENPGNPVIEVGAAPSPVRELFLSQHPSEYARYGFSRVDTAKAFEGRGPSEMAPLFLVHDVSLVEPLGEELGSGYACREEWDTAHAVRAWLFRPTTGR